jgi:hypothetical protein
MLRIDPVTARIATDYQHPYLELVRLLTEAAGIEHSLMKTYLFGLFSVKEKYNKVRGDLSTYSFQEHAPAGRGGTSVLRDKDSILAVALEEMQHLGMVNRFLAALGAAPNFIPHVFPYSSDVYPFDLELRALDRYAAATYVWIEADECSLSLASGCAGRCEPKQFIADIFKVLREGSPKFNKKFPGADLGQEIPNHVGSIYHAIVETTQAVAAHPPRFLPTQFPWGEWIQTMNWIVEQGEIAHYRLFRGIFTGEAFGSDHSIWKHEPKSPDCPFHPFVPMSAYSHRPNSIPNDSARRVAWLANLHYWIILTLLDASYRSTDLRLLYKGVDNMTLGLWVLGGWLAKKYSIGLPFDQFGPQYMLGKNAACNIPIIHTLVVEAQDIARQLLKDQLLPPEYDLKIFDLTLAGLQPGLTDPDAPLTPSP